MKLQFMTITYLESVSKYHDQPVWPSSEGHYNNHFIDLKIYICIVEVNRGLTYAICKVTGHIRAWKGECDSIWDPG